MKKFVSRAVSMLLVAFIGLSLCVFPSAATLTYSEGHTVTDGVTYTKYSMAGASTQDCTVLTFDPQDGYIPMVFSAYAGTSGTLATQYNVATNKYGYDVAGGINGAFFSMDSGSTTYGNYGTPVGLSISNGKIASAHIGYTDSVLTFASDGTMKICESALKFTLTLDGKSYDDMIYYVNKTSGSKLASNWSDRFYYYDTSCGSKADTYAVCPGTEILCKKLDCTDLAVGQTLVAEVISITENTYGGSIDTSGIESDNFLLFIKDGSAYESYISGLSAGSSVKIRTEETVSSSKTTMENANSVISNVGWLVKNGINQTTIYSTIGTHSVTLQARWTAFGTRSDGSYVFFTSEGGSTGSAGITLRNVATAMMELGCNNVIRMDGGGSSGMYVSNTGSGSPGYVQYSSRAIADSILIVNRDSVQKPEAKAALSDAITAATTENLSFDIPELAQHIATAQEVLLSTTAVSGDHKREIMKLLHYIGGENLLSYMLDSAFAISSGDYCDRALDRIALAYNEGKRLLSAAAATGDTALKEYALKLSALLEDTDSDHSRISLGVGYDSQDGYASYPDSGSEMTDGVLFGEGADSRQWTGYHISGASGTENGASYTDVLLDLGESKTVSGFGVSVLNYTPWGISAAPKAEVLVSENGTDFYFHSQLTRELEPQTGAYQVIGFDAISETVSARYVVFRLYYASNFLFVGETSVYGPDSSEGAELTGIDISIRTDYTVIFTPDMGTLNNSNSNAAWSHLFICSYNTSLGGYLVDSIYYHGGDTSYSHTVPENGFIIGIHGAAFGTNASSAQVGDRVFLSGVELDGRSFSPGAKIIFDTPVINTVTYTKPNVSQFASQSGITVDGSYVYLPSGGMTASQLKQLVLDPRAVFSSSVAATGVTVSIAATSSNYTFVLMGDTNGDGTITAIDYLMLKRMVLGTYSQTEAQSRAACVSGGSSPTASDYLIVKRAVLGTYNI